ncbi:hypothetical protein ABZ027_08350 [Streptomyces sp. NPDC006332]|uniref:hypothetical protein n=1 Tax=Streptomyces sp. NPDC006332 TaxID=3155456 RepID=UPI0033A4A07B
MGTNGYSVTGSAAQHAERLRAREAERAAAGQERDGRQTAEIYGERAAAGWRADEALREQARRNDARARGEWVPGDEPEDVVDDEEFEDAEEEGDLEDGEEPVSTAELYARRERARQQAGHRSAQAAHRGGSWAVAEQARRFVV